MTAQHDALFTQLPNEFFDIIGRALRRVEPQVRRRDLWGFLREIVS
jgi:hypothetical protein